MHSAVCDRKVMLGAQLSQLIQHEDFPVDVKDCAGKYTENNRLAAVVSGLEPEERIGLSVQDIATINRMPKHVMTQVIKADRDVTSYKKSVYLSHVFLDKKTQFIVVDRVCKHAVVNQQEQTIGILSYAKDMLPYIDRWRLYALYKDYYTQNEAITFFLKYLKVAQFFITMPTELELRLLLHTQYSVKDISQKLSLPLDAVRSNLMRVQDKLIVADYKEMGERLGISTPEKCFDQPIMP